MAEFNYYGNRQDAVTIITELLNSRLFKIVAAIAYTKKKPFEVTEISHPVIEVIMRNHQCFLFPKSFNLKSIVFSTNKDTKYSSIHQLRSGPLLALSICDEYYLNEKNIIGHGNLNYPPFFYLPKTNLDIKPTQEIKDLFLKAKKIIQKSSVKRYWCWQASKKNNGLPSSVETLWIGKNAMEHMKENDYFIKWGRDIYISSMELYKDRDLCNLETKE